MERDGGIEPLDFLPTVLRRRVRSPVWGRLALKEKNWEKAGVDPECAWEAGCSAFLSQTPAD